MGATMHSNLLLGQASEKLSHQSKTVSWKSKGKRGSPCFQQLQLCERSSRPTGGQHMHGPGGKPNHIFSIGQDTYRKDKSRNFKMPSLPVPNILEERQDF